MDFSVARNLFGALTLALADEIACAAASLAPEPGPAAAAMVFLGHEPGQSISTLAYRIGPSHAGTVRLINRLEVERLVERRRHPSDRRARFIHLTALGEEAMAAVMRARDRVISSRLSPLSADELSTLGAMSEHLLRASVFDNGVQSLCRLCGYSKRNLRSLKNDGCSR